ASAISVLFAVLSALTLLPALISVFHKRIRPKQHQMKEKETVDTPWSKFVVGKPAVADLVGLVVLGLAIIPMSHVRLGMPDDSINPADSTGKKAYDMITDEFGEGYSGEIVMLLNTQEKDDENATTQDLDTMADAIEDFDKVDAVASPQLNEDNNYALI